MNLVFLKKIDEKCGLRGRHEAILQIIDEVGRNFYEFLMNCPNHHHQFPPAAIAQAGNTTKTID